MAGIKTLEVALLSSVIIFSYYLILSNKPYIDQLRETNSLLYALTSTAIMLTLGFSMGMTWSLLGSQHRREERSTEKKRERKC
jgi:uncharacterized membrane protein